MKKLFALLLLSSLIFGGEQLLSRGEEKQIFSFSTPTTDTLSDTLRLSPLVEGYFSVLSDNDLTAGSVILYGSYSYNKSL